MTCTSCGSTIKDGSNVCSECGARIEPDHTSASSLAESDSFLQTGTVETHAQSDKKDKKKFLFIGATALIILAVTLLIVIGAIRQKNYETATALFDTGKYIEATEAFTRLRTYKDSSDRAMLSQNWADYTYACDLIEYFDPDDMLEAKQIFLSLGQFEDSLEKSVYCLNKLDYATAEKRESAGDYVGAQAVFAALGSFQDSKARARFCSDTLDYQAALALIEQGDFSAAADRLRNPAESDFEDAAEKQIYCNNKIFYAMAEQLLTDGENYMAYDMFLMLGTFEDAKTRALGCILEEPKNGELYHNENYASKQAELKVVNSYDSATFLKLYSVNGDLVCSFYILANKSVTVRVPAGTYTLNQAFGTLWFGPKDMFGNDGIYYRQIIGDSYEFTMKSNFIYTLASGIGGTPVGDSSTNRDEF